MAEEERTTPPAQLLVMLAAAAGGAAVTIFATALSAGPIAPRTLWVSIAFLVVAIILFFAAQKWSLTQQVIGTRAARALRSIQANLIYWVGFFAVAAATLAVVVLFQVQEKLALITNIQNNTSQLRSDLNCWAKPRHLTDAQIRKISGYLARHPSQQVSFVVHFRDNEASNYRADIERAIRDGGWKVTGIDDKADMTEGLTTTVIQTLQHQQYEAWSSDAHPDATMLLQRAFEEAGIDFDGSAGTGGPTDSLSINIGPRRADGYDGLYCPRHIQKDVVLPPASE